MRITRRSGTASGSSLFYGAEDQRFRLVLDEHPLKQRLDDLLFFLRQLRHRLELKPQVIIRPALVLVEQQHICAYRQLHRNAPQHVKRRL
ncbi:MAG: hypothetical protein WKF84_24875 [Pyrinomonadaceae bacterium]